MIGFLCSVQVRKWITDWNLDTEKKHTLLRLVYDALVDCKKRFRLVWFQVSCVQAAWGCSLFDIALLCLSVKLQLKWWWSYWAVTQRTTLHKPEWMHTGMTFSPQVSVRSALVFVSHLHLCSPRCIVRALKDPSTYLFDHLLALKPVRFLEGELIHDVRKCFIFYFYEYGLWMVFRNSVNKTPLSPSSSWPSLSVQSLLHMWNFTRATKTSLSLSVSTVWTSWPWHSNKQKHKVHTLYWNVALPLCDWVQYVLCFIIVLVKFSKELLLLGKHFWRDI